MQAASILGIPSIQVASLTKKSSTRGDKDMVSSVTARDCIEREVDQDLVEVSEYMSL